MEQSWRFRPIQGNICPTCSISHFPFCSQSPALDRNGFGNDGVRRFPLESDQSFHRPFLDPFVDNRRAPAMHRPPSPFDDYSSSMMRVAGNPTDAYGNSQSRYSNQNLEKDSFRQFPLPSQMTESAMVSGIHRDGFQRPHFDHSSNGFMRGEFVENDRFHKRMRVDETGYGSSAHILQPFRSDFFSNTTRISAENERRLNLIRDHGVSPSVAQSHDGMDSSGVGSGFRPNGYRYESSLGERSFDSVDVRTHADFEFPSKPLSNMGTNNFRDPGFVSVDRKGASMHPDRFFDPLGHLNRDNVCDEKKEFQWEKHGLGIGERQMQSNRNGFMSDMDYSFSRNGEAGGKDALHSLQVEQHLHSHYGQNRQVENSLHSSLQSYGPSHVPTGVPNYVDSTRKNQYSLAPHHEEEYGDKINFVDRSFQSLQKGDLNQQPHVSPISIGTREKYHAHDIQQSQSKDFMPPKEHQYPHMTNWQMSSRPNMPPHEQSSNFPLEHCAPNTHLPQPYALQHPVENMHDLHFRGQQSNARQSFEVKPPPPEDIQVSVRPQNLSAIEQFDAPSMNKQGCYLPISTENSMASTVLVQGSRAFGIQPPLPPMPPPPLPMDPPGPPPSHLQATSSPPKTLSSLYPIPASSSATVPLPHQPAPEVQPLAHTYFHNKQHLHASTGFITEGSQVIHQASSKQYLEEGKHFPVKHPSPDRPKVIDAFRLFRQPHRATRPDHIVVILRGLPGSGKSYLAKMLRDLEVENGGNAPRIHSMDDYFMTEVEKVEESEGPKSSSLVKGKKRITKKVMEYCYEPEMEEAYRSSMLKSFKKTLEEGIFTFIIVDDRNLRVADFAQFWAIAKRTGYEVFLLEATYKDPVGCAARNVHGFTLDDIQKMADQWEESPPLYLRLDVQSLFHGDNLNECDIQEVDMDTEEVTCDEGLSGVQDRKSQKMMQSHGVDYAPDGSLENGERSDAEGDDSTEVKELGRSKWSEDVYEEDIERTEFAKGKSTALSGLIQAYGKGNKSVHWGDQVGKTGFSIRAAEKPNILSLVIGPGSGYNLKSNPLPEEENVFATESSGEYRRSVFQEQLRAERESFRAVFDRRRQRIRGLEMEDE